MAADFVGGGEATCWVWGTRHRLRADMVLTVEPSSPSGGEGGLFPGDGIALHIAFRR